MCAWIEGDTGSIEQGGSVEEMPTDLGLGQAWPGVTLLPDPWLPRGGEDEGWGWVAGAGKLLANIYQDL